MTVQDKVDEEDYKRNAEKLAQELIKGVVKPEDLSKGDRKLQADFLLLPELQQSLNTKIVEFKDLNIKVQKIDDEIKEKERLEQAKEEITIDDSELTPEFVLLSLHKVVKHPTIIKYIEEVGDLAVYELNRGFGKNLIFFSKIDQAFYEEKMEELKAHVPLIQNSKRTKADKTRGIDEIYEKVALFQEKLDDLKSAGGIILLYVDSESRCCRLDAFAREEKQQTESLTMLKVYFGKNDVYESMFPDINKPEVIMTQIEKNLKKYGNSAFEPLQEKISELTQKLEEF